MPPAAPVAEKRRDQQKRKGTGRKSKSLPIKRCLSICLLLRGDLGCPKTEGRFWWTIPPVWHCLVICGLANHVERMEFFFAFNQNDLINSVTTGSQAGCHWEVFPERSGRGSTCTAPRSGALLEVEEFCQFRIWLNVWAPTSVCCASWCLAFRFRCDGVLGRKSYCFDGAPQRASGRVTLPVKGGGATE